MSRQTQLIALGGGAPYSMKDLIAVVESHLRDALQDMNPDLSDAERAQQAKVMVEEMSVSDFFSML